MHVTIQGVHCYMFTRWLAELADENVLSLAFQTHWKQLAT